MRRTEAHMYPWGVEIGSGRHRDFFPSRGLGSGALIARTRSPSARDARGTAAGARATRDNRESRWAAREYEACTALGGAWRDITLARIVLFAHEIFVGADETRSRGTRRSRAAEDSLGFENGERDELYCVNGNSDSRGARFVVPRRRDPDVASTRAASAAALFIKRRAFEISCQYKNQCRRRSLRGLKLRGPRRLLISYPPRP